jgi:glycyl-tRNA synthetase beta chain
MADLLLEIGCEELPSSFVASALAALPRLVTDRLDAARITHGAARPLGSPRRIALIVEGVAERQPDVEEVLTGPPATAAFDKEGKPTKGAEAFAKKLGVEVSALTVVDTPKGKYVSGTRKEVGRATSELLPKLLQEAMAAIPFRKSMRWGNSDVAFGRPIHWIVALLGHEIVPVRYADAVAGRTTFGHRFLSPAPIEINAANEYESKLQAAHVFANLDARAKLMNERLLAAATSLGGVLVADDFLVGENCGLVEEPLIVAGAFERGFLALPPRLVVDVMRTHQRYFAVHDKAGELMPNYLAVVNTANAPDKIRVGNDRVMRARLADARFFIDSDMSAGLGHYAAKLSGIRYHAKLGSVADKVARMQAFGAQVVDSLGLDAEESAKFAARVERATALCKADLASLTVGEFPELQGYIGRWIAQNRGEEREVALAIEEHWLDESSLASLGPIGIVLGLADKLDHLVGGFAVGLAPTGANDPFSMRRAFNRAINAYLLAVDQKLALPSLRTLCKIAFDAYASGQTRLTERWEKVEPELVAFMRARLVGLFDEAVDVSGQSSSIASFRAPRDVVEACIEASFDDLADLRARIAALREFRRSPDFARLATALKRATKITKDVVAGVPDVSRFDHPAEKALWQAYSSAQEALDRAQADGAYSLALQVATDKLAQPMDDFFDRDKGVYVMHDDPAIRDNRLRMLATIAGSLRRVARFEALEV